MRRGAAAAALLLLAAAAAGGATRDLDFEFADTPETEGRAGRYVNEPNVRVRSAACGAAGCGAAARCTVRRGRAVCVPRGAHHRSHRPDQSGEGGSRCLGCTSTAAAGGAERFLCGSDNRTYSSLCRLDLHNCVRRATARAGGGGATAVRPACRGVCPCPPPAHNEVLRVKEAPSCTPGALRALAARLLDWAAVLQQQAPPTAVLQRQAPPTAVLQREAPPPPPPAAAFPPGCLPEVRWMFSHLDADGDGLLSHTDLFALRHDDRERCLRPFLASCAKGEGGEGGEGGDGGEGGAVTRAGWCGCLGSAARPCARLAAAHPPLPGAYVPACDARGYFLPRQCHARSCWCVDPRGAELRVCAPAHPTPALTDGVAVEGAGSGAPSDDEDAGDAGGSGDAEPVY